MGFGVGVFLIVVGAVFTFAVDADVAGLNLDALGWIFMLAGVVGLVVTRLLWGHRRRVVVTTEPAAVYRRWRPTAVYRREPAANTRVEEERVDIDPL
ncbi:MAG TPA: DUF6458 family protein [Micromonosporaceae bacterium]|nr:DUF6458 family protein [Micromonosporaceae bacterium]